MKPSAYFINVGRGATVDEARAGPGAGRRTDRGRGGRCLRPGAAAARPSAVCARQRDPLAARLGLPAELRRLVLGPVRREPAALSGRRPAAQLRWTARGATERAHCSRRPSVTAAELDRHRYVSLATFRRNGTEVATPVWFADADGQLYVFTAGDSGKVKRLRRSSRARIAPCDARGGSAGRGRTRPRSSSTDARPDRSGARRAAGRSTAGSSASSTSSPAWRAARAGAPGSRSCRSRLRQR